MGGGEEEAGEELNIQLRKLRKKISLLYENQIL